MAYVMPLHWVMRLGREVWWAFRSPSARLRCEGESEARLTKEYLAGYRQGIKEGEKVTMRRFEEAAKEYRTHA